MLTLLGLFFLTISILVFFSATRFSLLARLGIAVAVFILLAAATGIWLAYLANDLPPMPGTHNQVARVNPIFSLNHA